jgi:hypothetical protein
MKLRELKSSNWNLKGQNHTIIKFKRTKLHLNLKKKKKQENWEWEIFNVDRNFLKIIVHLIFKGTFDYPKKQIFFVIRWLCILWHVQKWISKLIHVIYVWIETNIHSVYFIGISKFLILYNIIFVFFSFSL